MNNGAHALASLLNVYWLRPETALWRACDIQAMEGFRLDSPALDLGCGDGLFSFVRANGRFTPDFDAFKAVAALDQFFAKADVYDAFDPAVVPEIGAAPDYQIDVGFDHKANLLRKAQTLRLYKRLVEGDANKRIDLPDGSFRSIFSNIVYWLESPEDVLRQIARLLQPGGRACVLLPNVSLRDYSFFWRHYVKTRDARFKFLELIDRGRLSDNIKQIRSASEWRSAIEGAGLRVASHRQYLSRAVVQAWDIGLRPLFPVLHKLVSIADPKRLPAVKQEWIGVFETLLAPLLELDRDASAMGEPAFHCFVLER